MKKQVLKKAYTFDNLDQYDTLNGDYLDQQVDKYSPLVGLFLINFSILERELNLAIADFISDRTHEMGFVVIEKLTMKNKIELFYKFYMRLESFKDQKSSENLKGIKKRLDSVNEFRNALVHADWLSISKEGFVRTKIVVDSEEGFVKFKKVQITPDVIHQKNNEVEEIYEYKEDALQGLQ